MSLPKHVFREYDIRGQVPNELTSDFAYRLGKAFSVYLKNFPATAKKQNLQVCLGYDCRLTSPALASALMEGILTSGISVMRLGLCPTPATYLSTFLYHADASIMVTGSHNPPEYNGFKLCIGKKTLFGKDIQTIWSLMESEQTLPHTTVAKVTEKPILKDYLHFIKEHFTSLPSLSVVLDSGNGAASVLAPDCFQALGAKITPLFCEPDGRFPNHHPDPTVPENLKMLQHTVLEKKASFGIGYDGDADRIGVVDETGRIRYADELMVLFAREVLKTHPKGKIIFDVKSSHRLAQDVEQHGGKAIFWKTGHSLIKAKMQEENAPFAGEMSGHIFFKDRYFGFDDAIYASLRLYEILAKSGKTISELLSDLPEVCATPEIRLTCEESKKQALVETAKELFQKKGYALITIDGLRIQEKDRWGLLRFSNTQPVIVLRFEAETKERLASFQSLFQDVLHEACKKINHAPISFL